MRDKIRQLNDVIREAADRLGLVFVNGPDRGACPAAVALAVNLEQINGQVRDVYAFMVAEK